MQKRNAELTRARIVAAARSQFAEHGYDESTVRGLASAAGVAPNLITRYFGGKEGLFLAAVQSNLDVGTVFPGPRSRLGHRIAAQVVSRWESPAADPLLILMRSAAGHPSAGEALDTFFREQAFDPMHAHLVATGVDPGEATDRVTAVSSFILGVITARYVMRMGSLADTPYPEFEAWLGACLQRLIDSTASAHLTGVRRTRTAGQPG